MNPNTNNSLSEGVDPVTFSVLLHSIGEASKEMTAVLQNGARSTIISIARDHSSSIYLSDGQMLYQNDALPVHTVGGTLNIEAVMTEFRDDVNDGDVFMMNDPYMGTTHNSDLTVIKPVFCEGQHLFWTVVRAHQNNTGEASFGYASTNVWQDGIQIPPIRIVRKGKEDRSVIRFYLRNVRLPDWLEADLRAMIGAVRAGSTWLEALVEDSSVKIMRPILLEMIEYSARRTADEIRALPDGIFRSEGWIDSDGQGTHNIKVSCKVTIDGDMVHVDYSDSDPQAGGHCNATLSTLRACGSIPILTTIDPTIPRNEGCMRHITVTAPEGSVANAKWPSSTWWGTVNPGDILIETAWKALSLVVPDRTPAGWGRCQQRLSMGDDYRVNPPVPYAASILVACSGGGASKGYDGWPLTQCVCCLGGMQTESVEMVELMQPLFIEKNEFLTDSAGVGKWLGGHGCETFIKPYGGILYMKFEYEGTFNPPFGLLGGTPGIGGCKYKETKEGKRIFYMAHPNPAVFYEGETYVTITTGGGGYGSPLERSPESVKDLVKCEYVSIQAAKKYFGVVLKEDSLAISVDETKKLREKKKNQETTDPWSPMKPAAGEFWKTRFREGDDLIFEEMPMSLKLGLSPEAR